MQGLHWKHPITGLLPQKMFTPPRPAPRRTNQPSVRSTAHNDIPKASVAALEECVFRKGLTLGRFWQA
jgi:hypothetical protein